MKVFVIEVARKTFSLKEYQICFLRKERDIRWLRIHLLLLKTHLPIYFYLIAYLSSLINFLLQKDYYQSYFWVFNQLTFYSILIFHRATSESLSYRHPIIQVINILFYFELKIIGHFFFKGVWFNDATITPPTLNLFLTLWDYSWLRNQRLYKIVIYLIVFIRHAHPIPYIIWLNYSYLLCSLIIRKLEFIKQRIRSRTWLGDPNL
jgi:hypothetical protein